MLAMQLVEMVGQAINGQTHSTTGVVAVEHSLRTMDTLALADLEVTEVAEQVETLDHMMKTEECKVVVAHPTVVEGRVE
jgi:hypothetical protein